MILSGLRKLSYSLQSVCYILCFIHLAFVKMADKPEGTVLVEPHVEKTSPADKKSKKDKKAKKEGREVHQKEKPKADPDQPQKSKAELRAERRAKQVCRSCMK